MTHLLVVRSAEVQFTPMLILVFDVFGTHYIVINPDHSSKLLILLPLVCTTLYSYISLLTILSLEHMRMVFEITKLKIIPITLGRLIVLDS